MTAASVQPYYMHTNTCAPHVYSGVLGVYDQHMGMTCNSMWKGEEGLSPLTKPSDTTALGLLHYYSLPLLGMIALSLASSSLLPSHL